MSTIIQPKISSTDLGHEQKTGNQSLPRLQALLHWAYDVTKYKRN